MKKSNRAKNTRSTFPGWVLLVEYALGDLAEMLPDNGKGDGVTAGFLLGPFQQWGVPPELMCEIEASLSGFAHPPGIPGQPGSLRIFCQERVIDHLKAAWPSRLDPGELVPAPPSRPEPSCPVMNRGWGYFIIDRSGGSAGSSERCSQRIDLYLYQEGE